MQPRESQNMIARHPDKGPADYKRVITELESNNSLKPEDVTLIKIVLKQELPNIYPDEKAGEIKEIPLNKDGLIRTLRLADVYFQKIIMETKLSELSARTVAMEHATTKTVELVQKLKLNYTKQRRRVITQRQLESFTTHKII